MFQAIGPLGCCAGAAWCGAALGTRLGSDACLGLVLIALGALALAVRGASIDKQVLGCLSIAASAAALAVEVSPPMTRQGGRIHGVVEQLEERPRRWELVVRDQSKARWALTVPRSWSRNASEAIPNALGRGAVIEAPVRDDGMIDSLSQIEVRQSSFRSRLDCAARTARRAWRERVWLRMNEPQIDADGATAGLVLALVAGDGSRLTETDQIDLRAAGLMHLIVASGAQVGLLAIVSGFVLAPWFGPAHRVRVVLVFATAVGSALMLPDQAPVRRASVALMGAMVARLAGRGLAGRHALSLAVLWLALSAPEDASSLSLVLSVVATAAIVWSGRTQTGWRRSLIRLTAPSLVTWHLISSISGRLALWGAAANLAAAAPASLALISGWIACVLPSGLYRPASWCASRAAEALRELAARVADLPGSGRWLESTSSGMAALGVCAGFGILLCAHRSWRTGWAVVWLALVWHSLRPEPNAPVLDESVAILDVGQGSAALFGSRTGALMIDAGPANSRGAAAAEIVEEFRRLRLRRLDGLFLTHADRDHAGGALDVMSMLAVDRLFIPPGALNAPRFAELIRYAARKQVPVETLSLGDQLRLANFDLQCLHPAGWDLRDHNDASLVLAISGPRHTTIAMGDVGGVIERGLIASWRRSPRPVLFYLAAHHGSRTSSDRRWLETIRPRIAIVSAGRRNRHGHPDPRVVERLRGAAGALRLTATHRSVRYVRHASEADGHSVGKRDHERMRHEASQHDE